eukprot:1143156-Pelagomonas_calceolata.AAC.6
MKSSDTKLTAVLAHAVDVKGRAVGEPRINRHRLTVCVSSQSARWQVYDDHLPVNALTRALLSASALLDFFCRDMGGCDM